jgi:hypothetical protein
MRPKRKEKKGKEQGKAEQEKTRKGGREGWGIWSKEENSKITWIRRRREANRLEMILEKLEEMKVE